MVTVPRPPPMPEVVREREGQSQIGQFFKGLYDAQPSEEGVTRFKVTPEYKKPEDKPRDYRWYKNVSRYRYKAGITSKDGVKLGGRFMKTPSNAPPVWKRQ